MNSTSDVIAEAERLAGPGAARDRVKVLALGIMHGHWRQALTAAEAAGDAAAAVTAAKVLMAYGSIRQRLHRETGL